MADEQTDKPKPKRRVRNPETFRERALKAAEAGEKPGRAARAKQAGGRMAKAAPLKRAARIKPPKLLARPLRVVGKVIFPAYFRNSWRELKLVTWPSWKESRQLTFAVLLFAVVFGAAIAAVDYGLDKVFKHILLK